MNSPKIFKLQLRHFFLWVVFCLFFLHGILHGQENGSQSSPDPHKQGTIDSKVCLRCHKPGESLPAPELTRPCDPLCLTCHKDMNSHHDTGMEITFPVAVQIRLTADKRIVCITCHDLTLPRFSDTPKKAQSLFQRIFQRKKSYKSYYLFMDNNSGQLCKHCH